MCEILHRVDEPARQPSVNRRRDDVQPCSPCARASAPPGGGHPLRGVGLDRFYPDKDILAKFPEIFFFTRIVLCLCGSRGGNDMGIVIFALDAPGGGIGGQIPAEAAPGPVVYRGVRRRGIFQDFFYLPASNARRALAERIAARWDASFAFGCGAASFVRPPLALCSPIFAFDASKMPSRARPNVTFELPEGKNRLKKRRVIP